MENGEWRMEIGEWRMENGILYFGEWNFYSTRGDLIQKSGLGSEINGKSFPDKTSSI